MSPELSLCENKQGKASNTEDYVKTSAFAEPWKGLGDPLDSQAHFEKPTLPFTGFVIACSDYLPDLVIFRLINYNPLWLDYKCHKGRDCLLVLISAEYIHLKNEWLEHLPVPIVMQLKPNWFDCISCCWSDLLIDWWQFSCSNFWVTPTRHLHKVLPGDPFLLLSFGKRLLFWLCFFFLSLLFLMLMPVLKLSLLSPAYTWSSY